MRAQDITYILTTCMKASSFPSKVAIWIASTKSKDIARPATADCKIPVHHLCNTKREPHPKMILK